MKSDIFVIGGGGSGLAVYRKLARQGVPFVAGVLHEHDIDYEAAKYSAAQVIVERAFEPIREETLEQALLCMEQCPEVICCLTHFGTINQGNKILLEAAQRQKKLKNS